mmetsp:Transcript_3579/g.5930  ORF Transcript_3579/g.5930 Transcript_3579/m.5930 type:complete len:369 (+) Transcript_3579:70-1176(+)
MKTADELIASVDATLEGWRSALDSSLPHGKEKVAVETASAANKKRYIWEDSEKYLERLATFKPDTYFAKPLAISPLVCAAFGWENVNRDIIKCTHNQCKATLCIKFHPALDKSSKSNLCAKYLKMLASSHNDVCPFQSFAKRSLKVMERKSKTSNAEMIDVEEQNNGDKPAALVNRVEMALERSTLDSYVPPYMLPLCNEMKRFEDFTGDGSVTKQSVEESAIKIQRQINAKGAVAVEIPEEVSTYCREILSDPNTELFDMSENCSRDAYLLSAFGWSLSDEYDIAGNMMGVMLRCNICLSKSIVASAAVTADSPRKKKGRIDDTLREANIKLLDSHRAYCPISSGFARDASDRSEPGWKAVLSNLKK